MYWLVVQHRCCSAEMLWQGAAEPSSRAGLCSVWYVHVESSNSAAGVGIKGGGCSCAVPALLPSKHRHPSRRLDSSRNRDICILPLTLACCAPLGLRPCRCPMYALLGYKECGIILLGLSVVHGYFLGFFSQDTLWADALSMIENHCRIPLTSVAIVSIKGENLAAKVAFQSRSVFLQHPKPSSWEVQCIVFVCHGCVLLFPFEFIHLLPPGPE